MKKALAVFGALAGALLVLAAAAFLYYFSVTKDTVLRADKLALSDACVRVTDAEGREIRTAAGGRRVSFSALPSYVPNAFVAVEDKNFYSHSGFDYRRIAKAAMKNLASLSFREGASTISQQLVKNTHLSGEKTVTRKLREMKLTRMLEKRYSKKQILELYLNSIYFGHNAFGIESAALFYFGKNAESLTPAESATLAALVKSPNRYSPFRNAEKCLLRRNFVLRLMLEQGYLDERECAEAISEPLPERPADAETGSHYLSLVFDELSELMPDLRAGQARTLRVETFLDRSLQSVLEEKETESDFALLVRGNDTHGVKAYRSTVGNLKRLPASTLKPLAVYAPALEENLISPATPVLDEKVDFGGYSPENYGKTYGGYMSVRHALAHSVNVPAVKILNSLGVERAAKYLDRVGLYTEPSDRTLALALGGMKEGYSLRALADAYAVFANGGSWSPSGAISRIYDETGALLYEFAPEKRTAFSADVCSLMNDMLETAAREGTAKRLRGLPFPVCAKTGTGGTERGNTDAYTIAYTKDDTVAVWLGNRDNSPVDATGGGVPANFALSVLEALYRGGAPRPFDRYGVEEVALDREEYENNHRLLRADPASPPYARITELFRSNALPEGVESKFSRPRIEGKPKISVVNGSVLIELCQTKYYAYVVKRKDDEEEITIYEGKYREKLYDNSVSAGKSYVYTVIPVYNGTEGEPVVLPSVFIRPAGELPDEWWE